MKDNKMRKVLLQISNNSYSLAWQFVKLAVLGPFLLALIFAFSVFLFGRGGIGEDVFIKICFLLAAFPFFCFFTSGLSGTIGYLSVEKSVKHLYGELFTNIFLTLFGGYGSISIVYVIITKLF